MSPRTLLALAEALCGAACRGQVFEPLVADWQREWHDARGWPERASVLIAGGWGFAASLIRCAHMSWLLRARPALGFSLVVAMFAVVFTVLALLPMQVRFLGAGLSSGWFPPSLDLIISRAPHTFLAGLAFAVLPAMLLSVRPPSSVRRIAATLLAAIAVIVVLDGWVVPWTGSRVTALRAQRLQAEGSQYAPRLLRFAVVAYPTTSQLMAQRLSPDPLIALDARQRLAQKVQLIVLALTLGLFGAAVGVARNSPGVTTGLTAAAAWWVIGALFYVWLRHWSPIVLGGIGAPRAWAPWLPALVISSLGALVLVAATRAGERPEPIARLDI